MPKTNQNKESPLHNPVKSAHAKAASVDAQEMEHFAKMAADWWNPNGKFKPLHIMNTCRLGYLKDEICAHFLRDPDSKAPLKGLRILDIGCGGGLLSEPLARLGAAVTGIDALEANIEAAKLHAEQTGLEIDYRFIALEDLVKEDPMPFDVVLNMEILEHVTDPEEFILTSALLVREGGLMFCSTLNRTLKAFGMAILGAEYLMRWLPKGTHQYAKFIRPEEMTRMLRDAGLTPDTPVGMSYNPLKSSWAITEDTSVNYLVKAQNNAD